MNQPFANTETPLVVSFAKHAENPPAYCAPEFGYDPETQVGRITYYAGGNSSGCTKATYSTASVGKDPEGDYAADD